MLCTRCENFDVQAFRSDAYPYRGFPLSAVAGSADRGCSFCSLLLDHLQLVDSRVSLHREEDIQNKPGILAWLRQYFARPPWVHISLNTKRYTGDLEDGGISHDTGIMKMNAFVSWSRPGLTSFEAIQDISIHLNVAAEPGTAATRDIVGNLVMQDALTLDVAKPIKAWHSQCSSTHRECNQTLSRRETINPDYVLLPSRCIKVSYDPTLEEYSYQLCNTTGQLGRYIILSHRWGPETFTCRTTHENYAKRTAAKPIWDQTLTRLFSESCNLACHLDIPFVWIDSLCIIQDDPQDWEREAVKMASYYQYAWITISATMTSPETGGLFGNITTANLPRVSRLPYRDRQGVRDGYLYVQCAEQAELNRVYQQYVKNSELLTRGWVYQEWLLSPRIVAFTPAGVIMVCSASSPQTVVGDLIQDQSTIQNQRPERFRGVTKGVMLNMAFKTSVIPNMYSLEAVLESWRNVVATYSGMAFTQLEADRLVALAGVASEFGQALRQHMDRDDTGDDTVSHSSENSVLLPVTTDEAHFNDQKHPVQYVCGLWLNDIVRGLQWEQRSSEMTRYRVSGLPTWSWASLASVSTDDQGVKAHCGQRIQWAAPHKPYEDVCCVVDAVAIPVDEHFRPDFNADVTNFSSIIISERSRGGQEGLEQYGNSRRFVALALRCILLPVRLHSSPFETEHNAEAAAILTAHDWPDTGSNGWRSVARAQAPQIITGWASLDTFFDSSNAHQGPNDDVDDEYIYALVLTRLAKVHGGWGYGNLLGYNDAFVVLFVKRVAGRPGYNPCFERIGIGRLFGPDVDADFKTSEETSLWLV